MRLIFNIEQIARKMMQSFSDSSRFDIRKKIMLNRPIKRYHLPLGHHCHNDNSSKIKRTSTKCYNKLTCGILLLKCI